MTPPVKVAKKPSAREKMPALKKRSVLLEKFSEFTEIWVIFFIKQVRRLIFSGQSECEDCFRQLFVAIVLLFQKENKHQKESQHESETCFWKAAQRKEKGRTGRGLRRRERQVNGKTGTFVFMPREAQRCEEPQP